MLRVVVVRDVSGSDPSADDFFVILGSDSGGEFPRMWICITQMVSLSEG